MKHRPGARSTLFRRGDVVGARAHRFTPRSVAGTGRRLTPESHSPPNRKGATHVRVHRTLLVSIVLSLALAVPAGALAKRLIIGGSTSVLPLAQKLATAYHQAYPKLPAPKVGGGQSDIGISGAAKGSFDIGDSSRDPIPGVDPKGLVFTRIARDGVCVITNRSNPISNLSQESVEGIFTGRIRDWSKVPGSTISGPIDLFDRDGASGTQDAFQHIFLGETLKISPTATAETSNGLEQNAVSSDKQAVGFVSFAYTAGVNPVGYQGIPCNLRNAKSGQYGGVRNFWMVTKGRPKGESLKFIKWVVSGNSATKRIINSSWIAIR
ncbi:MAG: phosphate ABC transporter substrate-binding protein [Solirubrobacterales bacterium]|nr:phosphate ABC transporter substrate-binding protein [Solirubrobacterales bacterium]